MLLKSSLRAFVSISLHRYTLNLHIKIMEKNPQCPGLNTESLHTTIFGC